MKKLLPLLLWVQGSLGMAAPDLSARLHTGRFTVEDAITKALITSPRLKQAQAEQNAQREKKRGAWADVGPRVKGMYNEVHYQDQLTVPFGSQSFIIRDDYTKLLDLQVLQPITGAFALMENARLQGLQEDMSKAGTQITEAELAFQAADSWLRAYQADRQVLISEASIAASESQLKDASALERAGRMNRGDVLKLELLVSESRAQAAQIRAFREIAFASLRETIGVPPGSVINLSESLPTASFVNIKAEQALSTALERRLEMVQAHGGVDAAQFGKKLAYAEFLPSVNIFLQFERNLGNLNVFGMTEKTVRTYGIQLNWDLWNNGSTVFAVREAAQRKVSAQEGVRATETTIRLEVLSALANLKSAQEFLDLAKVAVEQASEAYRIEKARFMTGTRSATDLVLAQTSATGAKVRHVTAQTDLISSELKYQKALGEGRPQFTKL